MARHQVYFVVQDLNGNVVSGAGVYVYLAGTTTQANVYLNKTDTDPVTQPLTSGSDGSVKFWLEGDEYDYGQLFDINIQYDSVSETKSGLNLIDWDAETVEGRASGELALKDLSNVTSLGNILNLDGSGSGLDADKVDGYDVGNSSGQIPISNGDLCNSLNADLVDGFHASQSPGANQIPVLRDDGSLYLPGRVGIGVSSPNSLFQVGGAVSKAIVTVNGNVTLDHTHYTVLVNASSAEVTVTLPAASECIGREYVIKKIDSSANVVTIDGNGSETIDGQLTYQLTVQWQFVRIQSDGIQWVIVGR